MNVNKRLIALAVGVIFLDQLTKEMVKRQNFLYIRIIHNPGLPFGASLPGFFVFPVLIFAFVVFSYCYFRYLRKPGSDVGFALILGGAVANFVDRLWHGSVEDFLNVGVSTLNVADVAILAGIGYLLIKSQ